MNKLLIAACFVGCVTSVHSQPSTPGSAWVEMSATPASSRHTEEKNNVILQSHINQGIVVANFGDTRLIPYAALNLSIDKNRIEYNNKVVPTVGVRLSRKFGDGIVEGGVRIVNEHKFRLDSNKTTTSVQLFVSAWYGWDLTGE